MKGGRRVVQWFRVVSPPGWSWAIAITFYIAVTGLHQYTLALGAEPETVMVSEISSAFLVSLAVVYGLFRGVAFHPAVHSDYLMWLSLTPWRFAQPLPLGPVRLVAQDWIVLGLFELLLWDRSAAMRLLVPALFLFAVATCWAVWIWVFGSRRAAYGVGYALGATLGMSSFSYVAAGACLIATCVVAHRSLGESFASFPWPEHLAQRQRAVLSRYRFHSPGHSTSAWNQCGWAFDPLSPQHLERLSLRDRLLLSGLTGWWAGAVLMHSYIEQLEPFVVTLAAVGGGGYSLWLVSRYVRSHLPPISLLGRLATGRWVIPSYDIALLPVVYYLMILGVAGFLIAPHVAWPARYVVPIALTLFLLLTNAMSPELNRWRLTCPARLSPWAYAADKRDFEQL